MFGLDTGFTILLLVCLLAVCAFEFINGFHDTANAVATVIYTNSLKPQVAVVWSGLFNFIGVNVGGIAVAMGIVNLLPTEALVDANMSHAIAMIMALILTAIIWNLGTWYFGIPCSSSHTLIGSIVGVGIAFSLLPGSTGIALNYSKVAEVGLSLFVSPVFGFGLALLLMWVLRKIIKSKVFFEEQPRDKKPPLAVRIVLISTCILVSFSHGSNDGQKGVGLVMMILIGIVPAYFSINQQTDPVMIRNNVSAISEYISQVDSSAISAEELVKLNAIRNSSAKIIAKTDSIKNMADISRTELFDLRKEIILVTKPVSKLLGSGNANFLTKLEKSKQVNIEKRVDELKTVIEFAPTWVILMISISLGLGTMIGWKRIVVTIGERIGKSHLTYAQGATAEVIAASTIGASTILGLPVSTTHVLSSGIAGTMVANGGTKNLQYKTVKNILMAWVLTLPVTIILSGLLFLLLRYILGG